MRCHLPLPCHRGDKELKELEKLDKILKIPIESDMLYRVQFIEGRTSQLPGLRGAPASVMAVGGFFFWFFFFPWHT